MRCVLPSSLQLLRKHHWYAGPAEGHMGSPRNTAQTSQSGEEEPLICWFLPTFCLSLLTVHPMESCAPTPQNCVIQPFGKSDTGAAVCWVCGWSGGRGQSSHEFGWVGHGLDQSHWRPTAGRGWRLCETLPRTHCVGEPAVVLPRLSRGQASSSWVCVWTADLGHIQTRSLPNCGRR